MTLFHVKHVCDREHFIEVTRIFDYGSDKIKQGVWQCPRCDEYIMDENMEQELKNKVRELSGATNLQD